jgi:hypothetical protein
VTARWVVDEVRPHREVDITWQPISLFRKNGADPGDERGARYWRTHRLLRVMESVRAGGGDVEALYWEYGRRIHHDRELDFAVEDALSAAGLEEAHAAAYDDEQWDDEIASRMDVGIGLAGEEVGTPILGFVSRDGDERGYFGPVITRVPPRKDSLAMWDALTAMIDVQGFWELKRTRTERPHFGDRP